MGVAWLGELQKEQSSQRTLQGLVELPAAGRPLVLWNLLVCSQRVEQSERPNRQYTWCRVLVLWEIVSKDRNYYLFSMPTVLQLSI